MTVTNHLTRHLAPVPPSSSAGISQGMTTRRPGNAFCQPRRLGRASSGSLVVSCLSFLPSFRLFSTLSGLFSKKPAQQRNYELSSPYPTPRVRSYSSLDAILPLYSERLLFVF